MTSISGPSRVKERVDLAGVEDAEFIHDGDMAAIG